MVTDRRRKILPALAALLLLLLVAFLYSPLQLHLHAASLLLDLEPEKRPGWLPRIPGYAVRVQQLPAAADPDIGRTRLYLPGDREGVPGVVLVHGIHRLGIDEPRLAAFAHSLAAVGVAVSTPEMTELTEYRIEESTVTAIGSAAAAMARHTEYRTAGVIGISVAGGLALLAAADPEIGRQIGFVVCLGTHHDLGRVARYYAGQSIRDPAGRVYPVTPHPYGPRVLVHSNLTELFAPEDLPAARRVLRTYLHDQHRLARARAKELAEPARSRMLALLDHRNRKSIAKALKGVLAKRRAALSGVSPHGRLSGLQVPVFLLHGSDDPVVPATETLWLDRELPDRVSSRTLVSPVLRHAEIGPRATFWDHWDLIRFVAEMLATARGQGVKAAVP